METEKEKACSYSMCDGSGIVTDDAGFDKRCPHLVDDIEEQKGEMHFEQERGN